MSVYRRLARSKKGMSAIFGGLFFIIILLMGFNVMLWGFIQYDAYNTVITTMAQRDQQVIAENLVPKNPGAVDFTAQSFNITVDNLGVAVSIARIYIVNISPTSSNQCTSGPCTVDPLPAGVNFQNGNVQEGEISHKIKVTGILINDGSGYKVVLASTRGRLFSFYYPWPTPLPNGGQGLFQTNIGPLTIYFDFKSFNFTRAGNNTSTTAWVTPNNEYVMFLVKVTNSATDSDIKLRVYSSLLFQPYGGQQGGVTAFYIVDKRSTNPNNMFQYDENNANSYYLLPQADPNGPSGFQNVKFGAGSQGGLDKQKFTQAGTYLVFIGFYYMYKGQFQGQTVPFVAMRTCTPWPGC